MFLIDICVNIDVADFSFVCVLQDAWHVDVVVLFFERSYVKCEASREHTQENTCGCIHISKFVHSSTSLSFLQLSTLVYIFFSFSHDTFYNFPSSFSCCWEANFCLSHLHVVHERVYLVLKGGGFRSFLKYAHAISHVVCVIIRSTHTHPYTHHMEKKNDGEKHT